MTTLKKLKVRSCKELRKPKLLFRMPKRRKLLRKTTNLRTIY